MWHGNQDVHAGRVRRTRLPAPRRPIAAWQPCPVHVPLRAIHGAPPCSYEVTYQTGRVVQTWGRAPDCVGPGQCEDTANNVAMCCTEDCEASGGADRSTAG